MAQAVIDQKVPVITDGQSQTVRLPSTYHFSSNEVFIRQDPQSGVISLSEKPFRPSLEEVFKAFDAAIAAGETLELDRDLSLPREVNLF